MKGRIIVYLSVIVPAYNAEKSLPALLASLLKQTYQNLEVVIVDDGSTDRTASLVCNSGFSLIKTRGNSGPAHARNVGAAASRGKILVFTDADCIPSFDWAEKVAGQFLTGDSEAIMGRLILEKSGKLGNTISALGFPAGGSIGFEKVWKVDPNGYTSSFSTCNCAVKKEVFYAAGGFDESFPYPGGEDTLLAKNIVNSGCQIKYCPEAVVYHEARSDLREFFRWQFKRGISSYIFSRKVAEKRSFLKLRLWSVKNALKAAAENRNFSAVASLLVISYLMQFAGFMFARFDRKIYEGIDN